MAVLALSQGPAQIAPREEHPAEQAAGASPPAASPKPAYPPAAAVPTQKAPDGIRFDFNQGARISLPVRENGSWTVRLRDLDAGNILFETETRGAAVVSSKRFFVRFGIEVLVGEQRVFEHAYDCRGKDVLVQFPIGTLGDILAWFPYADRFQRVHGCKLTCALSGLIIPILEGAYPNITFVTHEALVERKLSDTFYASYSMGLFFDDKENIWQPTDFRLVGLHRTAGYILGVDLAETPPRLSIPDETRPISDPYVCIAVQSSSGCKMWNNPYGWREVVAHLKRRGYRVRLHRSKAGSRRRFAVRLSSIWRRGRDGRQAPRRAGAVAETCSRLHRPVQRPSLAGLGSGRAGRTNFRLHTPDQRVHHALPCDQLARLQFLLERSQGALPA